MNRVKSSSTLILIILIIAGSSILFIGRTAAQEDQDEVKLYLHRAGGGTLDTIPPVPSEAIEIDPLLPGEDARTYQISYPITRDLKITGNRSGSRYP